MYMQNVDANGVLTPACGNPCTWGSLLISLCMIELPVDVPIYRGPYIESCI